MATSFQRKLATAQSNTLDFSTILSQNLVKLTTALADAVGCPVEFLFFPLLTIVASCIGVNGSIQINLIWQEPAILWFIIAANKGQKTAALRLLKKPILEIEEKLEQEWMAERAVDQPNVPPQLCIDHFSFEELHNVMKRNGSQVLGLFDEISSLYAQLDLFKHSGSVMDRKTFITLNGGSSWTRNYRNYSASMSKTAFNICGFIQPAFVEKMLLSDDADGFNDRQLFCFPPQRDVLLGDLKVPIPTDVPALHQVYEYIRLVHSTPRSYTFCSDAFEQFRSCHDNLVRRQSRQSNEEVQGILSKAKGYVARTAMVLFVLEQALETVMNGDPYDPDSTPPTWSVNISSFSVFAASTIMDYFIDQKLIMMDLKEVVPGEDNPQPSCAIGQEKHLRKFLVMSVEDTEGHISPSNVAQKHICARVDGRYSTTSAMDLFGEASRQGFGEKVEKLTSSKRRVTKFRKKPYDILNAGARETLRQLRISEEEYRNSFRVPQPSSNQEIAGESMSTSQHGGSDVHEEL